jgi:hypothetical protein
MAADGARRAPACAVCALLSLNAVALVGAVIGLAAALAVDAAGPVGQQAQHLVAWAAAVAGSGALLGFGAAAACQRHLYAYFVAQLGVAAACAWLASTALDRVDGGALDELQGAANWQQSARQVLGEAPSALEACGDTTGVQDAALGRACWDELRPALRGSVRRSVVAWAACMLALQLLALLAAKWALTLPVIVVKTEITTSFLTLAGSGAMFLLALIEHLRVQTAFGRRAVGWCAGAAAVLLVLALWGLANTLLARRVGRWRSSLGTSAAGVGSVGTACTDSCFGASRLASLAVTLLGIVMLLVLAVACSSRPDALLARLQSTITDEELQQLLYEWQLLNCPISAAAATAEQLHSAAAGGAAAVVGGADAGREEAGSWQGLLGDEAPTTADTDGTVIAEPGRPALQLRDAQLAATGAVLSCSAHALGWETTGLKATAEAWLLGDVQRVCVLCAAVLAVRLLSVAFMIYHADDPAWTAVMDGKRHHLHPSQAIEQVRAACIEEEPFSARTHARILLLLLLRGVAWLD